jgi:MFS family permease
MLRRHWAFFLSCLCAFTAGHVVNFSIITYAQDVFQSKLLGSAGLGLCFGTPLFLGWYAGVLCDRRSAVNIIHFAQGMFVLAAVTLWVGHAFVTGEIAAGAPGIAAGAPGIAAGAPGIAAVAPLLLAALFTGIGWSFAAPARMTVLGQVVSPEELKPASLIFNLLVMLGFGLGPIVLSACRDVWGWPAACLAAGALAATAALLILPIKVRPVAKPARAVWADITQGLAAARGTPIVAQLLVSAMFGYMLMGPMQLLLPVFAVKELGLTEMQRGGFVGILAPSLIVGGVLALAVQKRLPNGKTIFAASALAGVFFAVLGTVRSPSAALVLLACIGVASGTAVSLMVTGLQANLEDAVRGRVNSMYTIISQVMPALSGVLAGGLLAERFGVRHAAVIWGVFLAVTAALNAAWMARLRAYRGHD